MIAADWHFYSLWGIFCKITACWGGIPVWPPELSFKVFHRQSRYPCGNCKNRWGQKTVRAFFFWKRWKPGDIFFRKGEWFHKSKESSQTSPLGGRASGHVHEYRRPDGCRIISADVIQRPFKNPMHQKVYAGRFWVCWQQLRQLVYQWNQCQQQHKLPDTSSQLGGWDYTGKHKRCLKCMCPQIWCKLYCSFHLLFPETFIWIESGWHFGNCAK